LDAKLDAENLHLSQQNQCGADFAGGVNVGRDFTTKSAANRADWDFRRDNNASRTRLGLDKDAPNCRPVESRGEVIAAPVLGGLHHRYCRI
jgi:hypothetical protein